MGKQVIKITTEDYYERICRIIQGAGTVLRDHFNKRNSSRLDGNYLGYANEKSEKELLIKEDLISQEIIIKGIFQRIIIPLSHVLESLLHPGDNLNNLFK